MVAQVVLDLALEAAIAVLEGAEQGAPEDVN